MIAGSIKWCTLKIIIMATYFVLIFNKTVAPGASTHHCKTDMVQNATDRELPSLQPNRQKW